MQTFHVDIIRDHFVITDDGHRILVDTGCPIVITCESRGQMEQHFLADVQRNVAPDITEIRGIAYLAQHKVLFDYQNSQIIEADPNECIPIDSVAEFELQNVPGRIVFNVNIGGAIRTMIFDTGASITDYINESIARTGTFYDTIQDFHPDPRLGRYSVERFALPVQIGVDTFNNPFGIQPAVVEAHVRVTGAAGVIGVGLYKNYKILLDLNGRKMILGR